MAKSNDKRLDDLLRRSVKEIGIEATPPDFTENLLASIDVLPKSSFTTTYKPLISKRGWGMIGAIVCGLGVLAHYAQVDPTNTWLEQMNWEGFLNLGFFETMPTLAVSNTMVFSLLIFSVFAVVQSIMLKYIMDRNYTIQ